MIPTNASLSSPPSSLLPPPSMPDAPPVTSTGKAPLLQSLPGSPKTPTASSRNGSAAKKLRENVEVSRAHHHQEEKESGQLGGLHAGIEEEELDERRSLFASSAAIRSVCIENGISKEQFVKSSHRTLHLDTFSAKLVDLSHMPQFTGLTSLCIMRQV